MISVNQMSIKQKFYSRDSFNTLNVHWAMSIPFSSIKACQEKKNPKIHFDVNKPTESSEIQPKYYIRMAKNGNQSTDGKQ